VILIVVSVKKLAISDVHSVKAIRADALQWTRKNTARSANAITTDTAIMTSWRSCLHLQKDTPTSAFLSLTKTQCKVLDQKSQVSSPEALSIAKLLNCFLEAITNPKGPCLIEDKLTLLYS
jgi:transcriptional regulator of acetoin/glycerol metabolism